MKAHELAKQLLEGEDLEVYLDYDGERLKLETDDINVVSKKDFPGDPEVPYLLFI